MLREIIEKLKKESLDTYTKNIMFDHIYSIEKNANVNIVYKPYVISANITGKTISKNKVTGNIDIDFTGDEINIQYNWNSIESIRINDNITSGTGKVTIPFMYIAKNYRIFPVKGNRKFYTVLKLSKQKLDKEYLDGIKSFAKEKGIKILSKDLKLTTKELKINAELEDIIKEYYESILYNELKNSKLEDIKEKVLDKFLELMYEDVIKQMS